jgi:hypothetical protein
MATFEVELTCNQAQIGGERKQWVQSVTVADVASRQLAVPLGIKEILLIAQERSEGDTVLVPPDAIKYWNDCLRNGSLQMYEVLSGLEQWGISCIVREPENAVEPAPVPPRPSRNGNTPRQMPRPRVPDLRTMLESQLEMLSQREKELRRDLKETKDELAQVSEDRMSVQQMLVTLGTRKRRKGKDGEAAADA